MFDKPKRVYSLRFSNQSLWYFASMPKTEKWVDRLAGIMNLQEEDIPAESESSNKIFFFNENIEDLVNYADLPKEGWNVYSASRFNVFSHANLPGYFCRLFSRASNEQEIAMMWQLLSFIYIEEQKRGGIPLHGAFVEHEKKGVLIAGQSNSGKSTLCSRFPTGWRVLSDDHSFIVYDKKEGYRAHPIPTWSAYLSRGSDKMYDIGYSLPVGAIFFLEKSDKDDVTPVTEEEAALSIYKSSIDPHRFLSWKRSATEERRIKINNFDNSCRLAKNIPAYVLRATRHGRCWEKMEEVLSLAQ